MRLRIVGSSSAAPRPGCSCSCYLIETAQTRVVLDCGSGAVGSLQRFLDPALLDAVLISHMHADHMFDLVPLRYVFTLPPKKSKTPLAVFVHPGGVEYLHRLARVLPSESGEEFFERAMQLEEYEPDGNLAIGDLNISFTKSMHYIDAYAIRVNDGRSTIVYSADTAPCERVVELARDADLFLCECALGAHGTEGAFRGHSNAAEAGRMARRANAKQLVLTHYGTENEPEALLAAAASEYPGPIAVAVDGIELSC